ILLLPGHASAIEWSRTFEGTEQDTVATVLETTTGELLITGWNNKQFIKGDNYIWVLKIDRNGRQMWRQSFSDGGPYPGSNFSAIETADSGFLFYWTRSSGPGNENIRICKINTDGLIEWQKFHGGSGNDRITALIRTSDGGYCATGWTNKKLGASNYDLWVLRLDHNGTICWQKSYGGSSSDKGTSIIQLPDSGYLIAGWTYSFGNGACEIWA
ncbi:MAG: hypothetical protein GY850_32080, partial [bacterium]|nr:hypothetical protein [bacterium]